MSQLRLDLSEPFTNRELFKNHFLTQRLTALPAWQDVAGAVPVFVQIRALYLERARHFTATTNEAQTEDGFIKPVLDLLWGADCRQVQVSIPNLDGRRQPDYALFRGAAERDAAEAHKGTPAYWAPVACVGDAKRWNVSLDQKREGETPSAQITNYLYRTRVRWGLLTNGRLWRLYEQERSRGGGVYFEVDLGDLLERGDADAFRWFWLFFRREAHLPDQSGRSFLETVLEGSEAYAAEVGDRLKDSVYDALRRLMNGLFDEPANHLDRHDPAAVARVHEHALILLYRLLFVLYAEDRDLLPRDNEHYQSISLCARHREINRALREGAGRAYQMPRYRLWQDLCDLFRVIDQGFAAAGIPAYNGGLFNPAKHPHLADHAEFPQAWRMADGPLAEAIDLLAYERPGWDQPGSKDIDYATLDVRHLGSIYEGLLELRPVVAAEALVEQLVEGKPKWVRAAEVAAPRPLRGQRPREVAAGELYLATDGGERKATGSFYTPAFIVDYIVEQTVGPLADAAAGQVAALRPQVEARVKELEQQQTALAARGLRSDEVRLAELERQAATCRESLLEPYLSLAILDPAMGSGHFLVGAADHLSLAMATDPNLPDPPEGVEAQAWYKRRVVERCLYGVDLNGLAVELAKLSLWLHTVSDDRALSFLDHHLRAGNSLIGARLERDLTTEPPTADSRGRIKLDSSGQMVLGFTATLRAHHLSYLLDTFAKIAGATAGDAAGERAKAAWYAEMDAVRERFRQVANLWLAPFGGAAVTAEQFEQAVEALGDPARLAALAAEDWFVAAQEAAHARRFFHWELEFPERYFAASGWRPDAERGFDAVIGNPPYVRQELLSPDKPYYEVRYPEVYHGMADLFVYFFGHGLELLRPGGRLSYISSNSWLQTAYAEPLRRYVRTCCTVKSLVDLGNNRTFAEAPDVCPSIFVIDQRPPAADHRMPSAVFARGETPTLDPATLEARQLEVTQLDQPDRGWQLTDDATRKLVDKLLSTGRPLGEVVGGRMYRGVLTGLNEAFIVDTATREALLAADAASAELLKPLVRGEDLRPWYQEDEGRWLIRLPAGWTRETLGAGLEEPAAWERFAGRHPAVAGWLEPFAEKARKRQDKGEFWWELRPCVYYDAFEQPKIFWPDICKIPRFSWDETGRYCNDKGSVIVGEPALLAQLMARTTWFAISFIAVHNKYRAGLWEYQLKSQFVAPLPVADTTPTNHHALAEQALTTTTLARERYALHQRVRHRVGSDLGVAGKALNQKLTAWWELDFAALRAELVKVFKHDIPVKERDEWETWFADQRAEHQRLTAAMIDHETELNDRVYRLYDLTAEEIRIVEETTRYGYGEV